ncbi:hypothetical protein E2I00_016760, partial [Balaenoptera physalus]
PRPVKVSQLAVCVAGFPAQGRWLLQAILCSKAQPGTFFASLRFPSESPFHHPCTLLQAMPERELWPAGPGLEPVTRIGSCDSMMSTTSTLSGPSDSNYDFLSAEEKECLLFLEETIGSLDTEADSGLSTDKSGQATTPRGPRTLPTTQSAAQGFSPRTLLCLFLPTLTGHPKETVQQGTEPKRVTPFSLSHLPEPQSLALSRGGFHSDPQKRLSCHSEAGPGDSGPASSSLQEQRRARREALEKLGLPQDQDEASAHLSRPSIRLRETRTQAPSPAPASAPAQPVVPAQVSAATGKAPAPAPMRGPSPVKAPGPAPAQPSSPGKVLVPAQEPTPGKVPAAKSMPIPIPKAPQANSLLTQPKPDSGLTLQESSIPGLRQMNFKSNTLERSGVGLSSYLSAEKDRSPKTSTSLGKSSFLDKISPNVLRNSRPRPASLGTRTDFEGIQVGKLADLEQGQGSKHLSYQGQSRDKLPRPPCVSVKISPKGVSAEHRREALKKLGLLKK